MVGDLIVSVSYCLVGATGLAGYRPRIALLESNNRIKEMIAG
jgi:aspartate 1-decarboxylase